MQISSSSPPMRTSGVTVPAALTPSHAEQAADPTDTAHICATPPARPLFAEAARLGLMTSGASVSGPLGQVLSQAAQDDLLALLREIEARNIGFAHYPNPNNTSGTSTPRTPEEASQRILQSWGNFGSACLNASIKPPPPRTIGFGDVPMRMARFSSLGDLAALDALAVRRDASGLGTHAQTLLDLEDRGYQFTIDPLRTHRKPENGDVCRPVGAYGAWRAMHVDDGWGDHGYLYLVSPTGGVAPLHDDEDVQAATFFELGRSVPRLDADARACHMRDLAQAGYTMHRTLVKPEPPSASFFGEMMPPPPPPDDDEISPATAWRTGASDVVLSVRGQLRTSVRLGEACPPALRELSNWDAAHLSPRVKSGRLTAAQAAECLSVVAAPAGNLSLAERGVLMERLLGGEKMPFAAEAARRLLALAPAGEGRFVPHDLADEFEGLRTTLEPQVALDALVHFRTHELTPEKQARLTRVAALGDRFGAALEVDHELGGEEHAHEILAELSRVHGSLSSAGRLERALHDVGLVHAHRADGETPRDALQSLVSLHQIVGTQVGIERSREAFVYLQTEPFARPRAEARDEFMQTFVLDRDLDAARRAASRVPTGRGGTIEAEGDFIQIGAVRVPRRR